MSTPYEEVMRISPESRENQKRFESGLDGPDDELGDIARSLGFRKVASGPLVRSSYHASDMAEDGMTVA